MEVTFWGVRGSLPAPPSAVEVRAHWLALWRRARAQSGLDLCDEVAVLEWLDGVALEDRAFVGANTACLEVRFEGTRGEELLILDAGTGIRPLGNALLGGEFGRGAGRASLLFSHFHWDHVQGWPFFRPAFVAGNQFDLYARHSDLEATLRAQQSEPFFPPRAWDEMAATIRFHQLDGSPFSIGGAHISTLELAHPSHSYAYRIEREGKSLIYATDGLFSVPTGAADDPMNAVVEFFRDADLVVFDAQFSLEEAHLKRDWGHSSAIIGLQLGALAGVKRLALFHHDPGASDDRLCELLDEAIAHAPAGAPEPFLAREELTVCL